MTTSSLVAVIRKEFGRGGGGRERIAGGATAASCEGDEEEEEKTADDADDVDDVDDDSGLSFVAPSAAADDCGEQRHESLLARIESVRSLLSREVGQARSLAESAAASERELFARLASERARRAELENEAALMRSEVARVHEMAARSQLSLQVAAGLIALKPPPGAVFDPCSSSSSSSSPSSSFSALLPAAGFGSTLPPAAAAAAEKERGRAGQHGSSRLLPPPPPSSSSSRDDPLSSAPLAALASALPHARRLHSQLVCGLTGRTMDDADPPAALPCGATFSESGLRALAGADGCVECPLHGEREGRTPLAQLRRVFVS